MVTLEERYTSHHSTGSARGNYIIVSLILFLGVAFQAIRGRPSRMPGTSTVVCHSVSSIVTFSSFIKPYGQYRYTRAPQVFCRRVTDIIGGFSRFYHTLEKRERSVNDTNFYDEQLIDNWLRAIEFLTRVWAEGIALNHDKFIFCERVVEFA